MKDGCKQGAAKRIEEEKIGADDIDYGNFIVSPNGSEEQPPTLSFPKEMTPKELELHMQSHLPYCRGCPYCLAGKLANLPHRRSKKHRTLPLMVADYGYLRCSHTDTPIPFIVM